MQPSGQRRRAARPDARRALLQPRLGQARGPSPARPGLAPLRAHPPPPPAPFPPRSLHPEQRAALRRRRRVAGCAAPRV